MGLFPQSIIRAAVQLKTGRRRVEITVSRASLWLRRALVVVYYRGLPVNDTSRNKRVRTLVKTLNTQRKKQAVQIDILCNDFIAAQREFLQTLHRLSFAADFYESLLAAADLDDLFRVAAEQIRTQLTDTRVAVFLRSTGSFELQIFESDAEDRLRDYPLENCFNNEAVNQVCTSNRICSLDALLEMGLQANPKIAEQLSAAAIPFGPSGAGSGFLLLYRSNKNPITPEQTKYVSAITSGLASAISARRQTQSAAT